MKTHALRLDPLQPVFTEEWAQTTTPQGGASARAIWSASCDTATETKTWTAEVQDYETGAHRVLSYVQEGRCSLAPCRGDAAPRKKAKNSENANKDPRGSSKEERGDV